MQEQVRVTPTDSFLHALRQSHAYGRRECQSPNWRARMRRCCSVGHGRDHHFDSFAGEGGDHIVAQRDIYGGVIKFLSQWLPKLGIENDVR